MRLITLIIAVFAVFPAVCPADTLHVPGNYLKIQDAIAAAVKGDTVLVAPGTYLENIDFMGKAILVKGDSGAEATTIDGGESGSVVTFDSGEGLDSILEGFTLTNGTGTQDAQNYFCGGGIYCLNSSPTIMNNTVIKNAMSKSKVKGAGIYCNQASPAITKNIITQHVLPVTCYGCGIYCVEYSSPVISGNIISENENLDWGDGGGICCDKWCDVIIKDNVIEGNKLVLDIGCGGGIRIGTDCTAEITGNIIHNNEGEWGGGIEVDYAEYVVIDNNKIFENLASAQGYGGGISFSDSDGVISRNVITNNKAESRGAGIELSSTNVKVIDNIIANNKILDNWGHGGGIYAIFNKPNIVNNIISGNSAARGGGIHCCRSAPHITNNTIHGNTATQEGGGIYQWYTTSPVIMKNTILWNNDAKYGPEAYLCSTSYPTTLDISYSNLMNGMHGVHVEYGCTIIWGPGMIDADPMFIDPAGDDFHLTYTSPCKDAGDNSVIYDPCDLEGDPRITNGTVDMGADEFHRHLYCTGDLTPGGSMELKFVDTPSTTPVILWLGSGVLDPPMHFNKYGDWYLEFPLLLEVGLGSIPAPDGYLALPFTIPAHFPAPKELPIQALSGSQFTNLYRMVIE